MPGVVGASRRGLEVDVEALEVGKQGGEYVGGRWGGTDGEGVVDAWERDAEEEE